ncbi:hypothetical protein D3273_23050 [Lichenibacterium minor]|uniref:Uncharacterized protein n=1 Tax=Lichenibacterium minor TaxID=2316528 RepID=A0A4Q2U4C4_9HYPH|nr:hypothetical protein [Lichenibacterium minor]RYC29635.1 hypothetical protein D3273_23050 [Lichenibacterium minor]
MSDMEGTFAFEAVGANGYAVVHQPTGLAWRFKVETSQPLSLRSLMPQRPSDTPAATKATSAVRRSAFQFAVAEARKLGLID